MAAGDLSLESETEEAARFCSRGSRCRIALCLKPPSPVLLRALPPAPHGHRLGFLPFCWPISTPV